MCTYETKRVLLKCQNPECGKEFYKKKCHLTSDRTKRVYCSHACYGKGLSLLLKGVDIPIFDKSSIVEVVVSNGAIIQSGNCLYCGKGYSRPKGKKPQKQDDFCTKECKDKYVYRLKKGTLDQPIKNRKPKVMITKPSDKPKEKKFVSATPKARPNPNKVDRLPKYTTKVVNQDEYKTVRLSPKLEVRIRKDSTATIEELRAKYNVKTA